MGNKFGNLFSIEREEKGLITLLLIQSVFLGIFYGVFNITAHSLFLAKFDETLMARAYILSGLAGSGLTWLYTYFQSRSKFLGFSILNLLFVIIVTLALSFLAMNDTSSWVIFAIFIMMGPLNILALLGFYGTTGRLFTLRQGKRLFGIIDTGIVVGVIVSSFSIPALLSLNINTSDILFISAISILAALIVQGIIGKKNNQVLAQRSATGESKSILKLFRKDRYILSMGFFVALSVMVMFFIQYSFMAVTRARYPGEQELARFLGLFEGSMMVFTLLIKTFLFSYLIKNHGLKITLVVGPVLIGLFAIAAVILGSAMGYSSGTSGFMIFFLILGISRLFSKAMKDSVETPAFKVLYQTLGEKVRYNVQSAIDGTVNEIAALSSGLLLSGLGALVFVKLIHFSWVLSIVIVLWILFAFRLYSDYRQSVRKSLESSDDINEDDIVANESGSVSARGFSLINNYFDIISDEEKSEYIASGRELINTVINLAENDPNPNLLPLFGKLEKNVTDNDLNLRLKTAIKKMKSRIPGVLLTKFYDLDSEIEKTENRGILIGSLFYLGKQPLITELLRLIRDKDYNVRRETLFLIGKHQVTELLPEVCDCLDVPEITKDAYCVLRSFGESSLSALSAHFFRSSGNISVRILIVRLFGETGVPTAIDFLLPRLWSVHRLLRKEAVTAMLKCGFEAKDEIKDRIIQEIQEVIRLLTWNISASLSLRENGDEELLAVIEKETLWWHNFLFDLLSLIYDKASFDKIKENLHSGTVESVNFALEMLDIVVDNSLKPRLSALLDVVNDEEKLKNLFQFYPGEIPDYTELVTDLINKDYNHISVWAKATALRSLLKLDRPENPDFIIALLFSQNKILREEAVRFLKENYEEVYDFCAPRIPVQFREHLSTVVSGEVGEHNELYRKVLFLTGRFRNIPEEDLISLSLETEYIAGADVTHLERGDYIVWRINDPADKIYINWQEIGAEIGDGEISEISGSDIYKLDINVLAEMLFYKPEHRESIELYIDNN